MIGQEGRPGGLDRREGADQMRLRVLAGGLYSMKTNKQINKQLRQ